MGAYDARPWLARYDEGLPHAITPEFETALDMFDAAVRRAPDRPAVHYLGATLSLAELDAHSDALAAALAELGVGKGDRVAIYLQNVPQFPIATLAIWKAGAIAVSINPMLKARELDVVLRDSGAVGLITLESLWRDVAAATVRDTAVRCAVTTSELDFLGGEVPPLLAGSRRDRDPETHDLLELVARHRGQAPSRPPLAAGDVAFLTYTSGTTGPPKGAMNTHENFVFNAQTYRDWVHLTEDDVVLGAAPLFHITGLIGHLAVALLVPMPLVLSFRFDPAVALELIERHRATFTVASITVFIALMNSPARDQHDASSLTKVYSGGAPIAPPTVEAFERQFGAYVHNIYGLTETTSPSHAVPFHQRAPVDPNSGALSVGVPIFNTLVRVVDEEGHELPVGEIGEFVTSGPQVVAGYWEKPQESEQALPGGELRTGDVGFMDEEGWFYLVDRAKDQINAAGYKVWPREVEDVLYGHPAVREAAVVGIADEYRGETVKAFVSLKPGEATDEPELISFCRERMAAYKYPRAIEFVEELPKTVTGKILRRELRERERSGAER